MNDAQRRRQPPTWMQEYESGEARLETVRLVMSLAAQNDWVLFQLDVKSAFLHGELNEEVFIDQPPGYIKKGAEQKVYRLKKALYGLKQAPRAWYSRIESYFTKEDDLIFTGNDKQMYVQFKTLMMNEFDMTDLGKVRYFLGIEVRQNEAGVFICQKRYAQGVLERFNMEKCNSVQNPIVPGCQLTRDEKGVSTWGTSNLDAFSAAKRSIKVHKGTIGLGNYYTRKVLLFHESSMKQPISLCPTTEAKFVGSSSCLLVKMFGCGELWGVS
ncbi:retrovirus-related pol polyprotein from transposon TNT 1-94 [Tanacetum coccineum]|uniref:Retrovirus-related pol polyprotein from transposon TNT 1-94 n=1 Tax=Tanacetum coccineum TaxID=301880 RepID=A0ABQ4ZVQ4_9ASTR